MDVIFEFVGGLVVAVQAELQLALLGMKDDGLALHAPDHVEGRAGFAPKGHFEHVLADSLLKGFT